MPKPESDEQETIPIVERYIKIKRAVSRNGEQLAQALNHKFIAAILRSRRSYRQ
jgi:hypothetical protein